MAREVVDYTKMRLGTITQKWEYKNKDGSRGESFRSIKKCPKCGRKGEHQKYDTYETYYHKAVITTLIPGFPMLMVKDHCTVAITREAS